MAKFRFQDLKIWQLAFENANILIILERRKLIRKSQLEKNLEDLDKLCRQITNFIKSLKLN